VDLLTMCLVSSSPRPSPGFPTDIASRVPRGQGGYGGPASAADGRWPAPDWWPR
jgi:hypothetical protein